MQVSRFYMTMLILWIGHFCVDFMIGIWPIYKTIVHLDLAKAGLLAGLCAFLGEGMQMVFGSLSDRGYRKVLILSGILMAACGGALYAYTESYFFLFFLILCTCMGSGAFHPSAVGLIGSLPSNRKALLVAIFATGGSLGMACSQFVFLNVYEFLSGHTMVLLIPSLGLIGFAFFYQWMGVQKKQTANSKKLDLKLFVQCFKNRDLLYLFASQICNQTFLWSMNFLLPDILNARGYESWLSYGGGYFCFIIGGALMMVPAGYLADRHSAKSVILAGATLGASFFYIFLFSSHLSSVLVLILLFLIGACLWIVMPVSVALGNRLMPNHPGVASALLMGLVWCVSESVGPGGSGLLTTVFESNAPMNSLACMSVLLIFGIFFATKLPKKNHAHQTLNYVLS